MAESIERLVKVFSIDIPRATAEARKKLGIPRR